MTDRYAELLKRIHDRTAIVAVVGLGYVGLPLALHFSEAGFPVLGIDCDQHKIATLRGGESYLRHVPSERVESRRHALPRFGAFGNVRDAGITPDVVIVCVPTPLDRERKPDLQALRDVADAVNSISPAPLIVLESTSYPGTTTEFFGNPDRFVAFSPEREDPGSKRDIRSVPKLVGADTLESRTLAVALYSAVFQTVVECQSTKVAEAAKLLENCYRAVNIALINEFQQAMESLRINVWEVIEAAKTKPFGFQAFYPTAGVGGHCIPVDPLYLTHEVEKQGGPVLSLIKDACAINRAKPLRVVEKLECAMDDLNGKMILVLGVAYKPDIDDCRESPAFSIVERLLELGAIVLCHDPYCSHKLLPRVDRLTAEVLDAADAVVICTPHSCYDWHFVREHSRIIMDPSNATRSARGAPLPIQDHFFQQSPNPIQPEQPTHHQTSG